MPSIQAAASSLAVQVNETPVHSKDEIEGVIAAQAREPGGSLIVMPDPFNGTNQRQIVLLAARYGVPAIYFTPTKYPELGGLIAYGSDFAEQFRQAAGYVDRILKALSLPTSRCKHQPSLIWSSTLRPPRRSGLSCRQPCSRALPPSSNETSNTRLGLWRTYTLGALDASVGP